MTDEKLNGIDSGNPRLNGLGESPSPVTSSLHSTIITRGFGPANRLIVRGFGSVGPKPMDRRQGFLDRYISIKMLGRRLRIPGFVNKG